MCNPPTFRVTANDEQWVLTASIDCLTCRGSGEIRESHGETLPCGCAFEDASPEVVDAIDRGEAFTIEPNPRWVAFVDQMYRALRGE
ncbi:hypothetical protein EBZ39_17400 [bacterium]|nr:hypothetical protein [bacterium]